MQLGEYLCTSLPSDVHARVKQVGPGTVLVLWDRDAAVQEFTVTVTQEAQSSTNSVNVACDKRGDYAVSTYVCR